MYEIALDLHEEHDDNPVFVCEDMDQLIFIIEFFFENGYDILIRHRQ